MLMAQHWNKRSGCLYVGSERQVKQIKTEHPGVHLSCINKESS